MKDWLLDMQDFLWLTLQVHATFEYSKYQKGYIDGHERIDVVQEHIEFISKL